MNKFLERLEGAWDEFCQPGAKDAALEREKARRKAREEELAREYARRQALEEQLRAMVALRDKHDDCLDCGPQRRRRPTMLEEDELEKMRLLDAMPQKPFNAALAFWRAKEQMLEHIEK